MKQTTQSSYVVWPMRTYLPIIELARWLHISIFTKNFSGLVQACTSLYQLVQVIKVHQVKSQQAKSKSWQVFCLKLFLDSASHDKLARPYKFLNFCSHWFERYGFK